MPLQSSGAISLANVQTEFGGSNPIGINEYYGVASGVPASGTISLYDFYGKSATAPVSATVVSNSVSVNEGNTATFTINTTNFPSGTLYWTILTSNMNASDFTDFTGDALSGSITISSSVAYLSRTLRNDITTEGSESFQLQVRTGSISGPVIATSPVVTVNDSSVGSFTGWMGPYPGPRTLGWSEVVDPVNTTNSFTGNTVTPGRQTRFTIYTQTYTTNSVTLRFYLAGSLNTTWTGGSHTFTPVIGSSSIRFDSTITDTDPYYGGGQGHYTPSATIYAIYADLSGIGVEVYYHEFEYANIGDPDYDD